MSPFLSWIVGGDTKEKEWHGKKTFSGVDSDNNHTGSTYEGNWLGEKKHGYGVWRRDDNLAWYKGNWHENINFNINFNFHFYILFFWS